MEVDGKTYDCSYVELGNPGLPHAVIEYPGLRDADEQALFALGKALRHHPAFAKGANVNFVEQVEENLFYERTWERGVENFTYACGTGTGSAVTVLMLKGRCADQGVRVKMKGGLLIVDIAHDGKKIKDLFLTGPTNLVCAGEILDEDVSL